MPSESGQLMVTRIVFIISCRLNHKVAVYANLWLTAQDKTVIPLPGMTHSLWNGDSEPRINVVITAVSRVNDKGRYKLTCSTSDSRMLALNDECDHLTQSEGQHGPDVCVRCNIVVR